VDLVGQLLDPTAVGGIHLNEAAEHLVLAKGELVLALQGPFERFADTGMC
jgi:hypothetical protein